MMYCNMACQKAPPTNIEDLNQVLQNKLKNKGILYLAELSTMKEKDLHFVPLHLRLVYDRKRVPILHTTILIIMVMCVLGISTAMFLENSWEKTVLSLSYSVLLLAASMNQGLIDKRYMLLDIATANAIFLLNLYFFALVMEWYHYTIGILFLLFFFTYNYYDKYITVSQYELFTNIWHVGVIIMIYLVPLSLKQKNLF